MFLIFNIIYFCLNSQYCMLGSYYKEWLKWVISLISTTFYPLSMCFNCEVVSSITLRFEYIVVELTWSPFFMDFREQLKNKVLSLCITIINMILHFFFICIHADLGTLTIYRVWILLRGTDSRGHFKIILNSIKSRAVYKDIRKHS